ncbi:MAG: hypothetical protein MHPSP_003574, partial [Paramarteilia canceri]
FNQLQNALSKYEQFFGEDSLNSCEELFEFCTKFEQKIIDIQTNKLIKDKSANKSINGVKQKVIKAFIEPFREKISIHLEKDKSNLSGNLETDEKIHELQNDISFDKKSDIIDESQTKEEVVTKGKKIIDDDIDFEKLDESTIDFTTFFLKKEFRPIVKGEESEKVVVKKLKAVRSNIKKDAAVKVDKAEQEPLTLANQYFGDQIEITSELIKEEVDRLNNMQGNKNYTIKKVYTSLNDLKNIIDENALSDGVRVYVLLNMVSLLLSSRIMYGIDHLSIEDLITIVDNATQLVSMINSDNFEIRIDLQVTNEDINITVIIKYNEVNWHFSG